MKRSLWYATLVALAVLTYHRALSAYFFDDDLQWLVGSWAFRPSNVWAFGRMEHFYRPVIDLYFAVGTRAFGGSPMSFHAANIAMHAANAVVLVMLLGRLTRHEWYAGVAALFFVVQPGGIDAVAWVGALAEPLGTLFGCLSLLWFLEWRETGRSHYQWQSWLAFAAALLTHESSVVFLPLLALVDRVRAVEHRRDDVQPQPSIAQRLRPLAAYAALTVVYLTIDLFINSRNYVVRDGHYTIGWHMLTNALRYIESMYVGRFDLVNDSLVVLVLAWLLVAGTSRTRLAVLWMLMALMPFVPFTWSNTSRYMYQPSIGLSMLMAEAVVQVSRMLRGRASERVRLTVVVALVALLAARSMRFAMHNVEQFAGRTEVYRREAARIVAAHGPLPSGTVIVADEPLQAALSYPFANALTSWAYQDPTITLAPY